MTPAGRAARTIRAEKSRRIRDFWIANPFATLGEAVDATKCARSALQRWRTKLIKEGKIPRSPGEDLAETPAPAPATSTSSTTPKTYAPPAQEFDQDDGAPRNDVGFFDRFKPMPPRPKPKPKPAEDQAEASTEPDPDPPAPEPSESPEPEAPKQVRRDIEFRLF